MISSAINFIRRGKFLRKIVKCSGPTHEMRNLASIRQWWRNTQQPRHNFKYVGLLHFKCRTFYLVVCNVVGVQMRSNLFYWSLWAFSFSEIAHFTKNTPSSALLIASLWPFSCFICGCPLLTRTLSRLGFVPFRMNNVLSVNVWN